MKKSINFSNTIVLGTGYSVDTFFKNPEKEKIIQSNTTISFQSSFFHGYEKYGLIPDVWTWSDPHASLEGLIFILDNESLFSESNLKILIPNFVDTSYREGSKYKEYSGTSAVWRYPEMERFYYNSLEKIKEIRGIDVEVLETYTSKLITKQPLLTKDCQNIFNNPVERFIIDRPIIGSFKYTTDNSHVDVWGRENKVSFFVFPIMAHLGCKSLGVAGFDFGGSRFFNDNTMHAFSINKKEISSNPVCNIVNTWAKEWYKYHNMKIYSLVGPGESGLNDILES